MYALKRQGRTVSTHCNHSRISVASVNHNHMLTMSFCALFPMYSFTVSVDRSCQTIAVTRSYQPLCCASRNLFLLRPLLTAIEPSSVSPSISPLFFSRQHQCPHSALRNCSLMLIHTFASTLQSQKNTQFDYCPFCAFYFVHAYKA